MKKKKTGKIYETKVIKTLEIKQRRRVTHERWGANKVNSIIVPNSCLEWVSGLLCRKREPRWASGPHELKSKTESLGRQRQLKFVGQSSGEKKLHRREAQISAEGPLQVLSRMLMCTCDEKTTLGCGMNFPERLAGKVLGSHKGL